jgi:hypothetical protein
MLYPAIHTIENRLNHYLKNHYNSEEQLVVSGSIVDESGAIPEKNQNKIILSLVNIEQETLHRYEAPKRHKNSGIVHENPPFNFNLLVLVAALHSDYKESLKWLSSAIAHFQSKPVLDHQNYPDLDSRIQKLTIEILNTTLQEMQNLWLAQGAKYIPSIIIKVRIISNPDDDTALVLPEISKVDLKNPRAIK